MRMNWASRAGGKKTKKKKNFIYFFLYSISSNSTAQTNLSHTHTLPTLHSSCERKNSLSWGRQLQRLSPFSPPPPVLPPCRRPPSSSSWSGLHSPSSVPFTLPIIIIIRYGSHQGRDRRRPQRNHLQIRVADGRIGTAHSTRGRCWQAEIRSQIHEDDPDGPSRCRCVEASHLLFQFSMEFISVDASLFRLFTFTELTAWQKCR